MTNTTIIKNPTWWKRRTVMEKNLTLLSALTMFIILLLAVALMTILLITRNAGELLPEHAELNGFSYNSIWSGRNLYNDIKDPSKDNVCLTPGCVFAASSVLKKMDQSVDPCDDFYRFTCGTFLKEAVIADEKTSETTFSEISDKLLDQLRVIIEEPIQSNEAKPFVLTKNLYKACMNKTRIEELGLEPVKSIVKSFGGWPVVEGDNWDDGSFSWKDSVYRFRRAGYSVDYFIDFSVSIDLKNSTVRAIDLDQASLGLSREYLSKGLNEKIVSAYYDYMVDIAIIFGADRERAVKELRESLEFEISLANISLPMEQRRNATAMYNPMSIDELQRKFPSIPWLEYMNTLLAPHHVLTNDEVVNVDVPKYFHDLEAILSNTPKRIQANYVIWRATAASVSYLNEKLRDRQLGYSTVVSGRTEREARWKECVDIVSGSMSLAVGSLYVRRYFNEDSKKTALEMVNGIRDEMYKVLTNVEWMDEKTRRAALEKAKSMTTHIAYPDELLDISKLESFYKSLEISPNDYLESILNLTKFGTEYSFSKLRQPVNKSEWITHGRPAVVNAFYSSIENSIQFPAGILQGSFFSNDRPKYMNYGAIGFVIGHEITHGFDDQGRQFDKDGNLVDWWQPETKQSYLEKARCIIQQYGNYTSPEVGIKLNGINTQGENIADNGGIKQAYYAYNQWSKKHGIEPRLPGLQDLTPQQMFWVSAATTWCSKYRPETLKLRINTGYHSPGEFRVLGPLSNLPEFARDFKCPAGSRMNPEHKCKVW